MKLLATVVFIAASAFAASAFAGQQHGRDSVYASAAAPAAKKYPDGIAASPRYGRDSVYSLGKPVRGTPVVADLTERFGRA
jgi:hypothetical protein